MNNLSNGITERLFYTLGKRPDTSTSHDIYMALCYAVRDQMMSYYLASDDKYYNPAKKPKKEVAYLSAEFLIGPQLGNNLLNLGLEKEARDAVSEYDLTLDQILEVAEEPGLGNGGLGRLAACYMPEEGTLSPLLLEKPEESSYRTSRWQSGGGGLLSTMHDYNRFCSMLINEGELDGKRILDPQTLKKMMENHLPDKADMTDAGDPLYYKGFFDGVGFGLGFAVVQDPVKGRIQAKEGEASWGGMASTAFWVDPAEKISCIFLTQLVPSGTHIKLRLMNHQKWRILKSSKISSVVRTKH